MSVCDDRENRLSNQFHSLVLIKREKWSKIWMIAVLTTITNTSRVLSPGVKHGTDNQKACSDRTFTYSKNKTSSKKTGKVLASRMAT